MAVIFYVFNIYIAGLLGTKRRSLYGDTAMMKEASLKACLRVGNEAFAGLYVLKDCSTHWNTQITRSEYCAREEEIHGKSSNSQSNVKSAAG